MKKRISTVILLLSLAFVGGLLSCKKINSVNSNDLIGGSCKYADEPVTITVKKIEKYPERGNNLSSGDSERLIIEYEMTFDDGGREGGETAINATEAKAKGVEVGKKFHASVHRLVSGTCNPEPHNPDFQEWK